MAGMPCQKEIASGDQGVSYEIRPFANSLATLRFAVDCNTRPLLESTRLKGVAAGTRSRLADPTAARRWAWRPTAGGFSTERTHSKGLGTGQCPCEAPRTLSASET